MASSDPVYLRVVADIRRQIVDGSLPPGALIPSRARLTRKYGVGETAARHALRVLAAEGLIVGRVGSGHYVRDRPALVPLHRWRPYDRLPFGADAHPQGGRPGWDRRTDTAEATPDIARRLRLDEFAPVIRTRYVLRGEGRPVQLATSYEPVESAHEDGARGPGPRPPMAGATVTEIVEQVYTRVPQPAESDVLALPAGVHVLHVERTHWAGDRPVETSDIVIPGDRFRLVYTHPLHA
ncbi:GntR family transcriptional regulator [Streptosporangium becharense]|uniref:GntR family transcriptional regulator n=1 Tax=Streptosporangium becharense TaxID=1816182 RepID=A0A7W9MFH3_9ACTN|nr:GntR family transcriptional regulator [Streptosporangium becharense]MBB2912253.1 GntR family transcriptional regulator [Streptosporangium becharense]MBB5818800.1 GntR family transcriptional regulator [Streptosporangium becharense]